MTVIRFLLIVLAVYALYRFIFHILIPVYKTYNKIHHQFRNMQQNVQDNVHANPHARASSPANNHPGAETKVTTKDYIDFEEIKE